MISRATSRGRWLAGLLMIVMFHPAADAMTSAYPPALPQEVQMRFPGLQLLGRGEMRWLGLRLYEAGLWVSGGARFAPERPHALALQYKRAIASERLVEASIREMRRLGVVDESRLTAWSKELARAFPSVAPGDSIVGLHLPGTGAAFWHEGRLTAEIRDAELARYFFAIWLDERTREPQLRNGLLGRKVP